MEEQWHEGTIGRQEVVQIFHFSRGALPLNTPESSLFKVFWRPYNRNMIDEIIGRWRLESISNSSSLPSVGCVSEFQ